MLKFDEAQKIQSIRGALALRAEIEAIVDAALERGVRNLCWLGIGGTWASAQQAVCHMNHNKTKFSRTLLNTFFAFTKIKIRTFLNT